MLADDVFEFTRPIYSSISLGLFPAASMRVGWDIKVGMIRDSGIRAFAARPTEYNMIRHPKEQREGNLLVAAVGTQQIPRDGSEREGSFGRAPDR